MGRASALSAAVKGRRRLLAWGILLAGMAGPGKGFGAEGNLMKEGPGHPQAFDLGLAKHVFIDDLIVAERESVTLTMNPPQQKEKVLWQTELVEAGGMGAYHSVLREGDRFRMWYDAQIIGEYEQGQPPNWLDLALYAESRDGIHWTKPKLGLTEFQGSRENNVYFRGIAGFIHAGTVFVDPPAKSPEERYKMVYGDFFRIRLPGTPPYTTVNGATSPDGLHWKPVNTPHAIVLLSWGTDTQNVAFFDPNLQKYVLYVRDNVDGPAGKQCYRRAARTESEDFLRFPQPTTCLAPDGQDEGGEWGSDIYNTAAHVYAEAPQTYYFFPSILVRQTGQVTIQLGVSRDGKTIQRPFRTPYVLPREGVHSQYMGVGMVRVGDELWMYCTDYPGCHGVPGKPDPYEERGNLEGAKYRLVQRLDGFTSFDAGVREGYLLTKPLVCSGKALEVNANARGGRLRVAVLDRAGRVLAESRPLRGDRVRWKVPWKDRRDLNALKGQIIQLRFTLRQGKLYAFQFCER